MQQAPLASFARLKKKKKCTQRRHYKSHAFSSAFSLLPASKVCCSVPTPPSALPPASSPPLTCFPPDPSVGPTATDRRIPACLEIRSRKRGVEQRGKERKKEDSTSLYRPRYRWAVFHTSERREECAN